MNNVTLIGNLGKEPNDELKKTTGGISVMTISIAVDDGKDEHGNRKTIWIPIEVWKNTADFLASYCRKGDTVGVEGRLAINQYTDNDGNRRERWKVVASRVERVREAEKKNEGNIVPNNKTSQSGSESLYGGFNETGIDITEEDLPF